jgi:hypothetical protein
MGLCRLHADIKLIIWNAGKHTTFRSDFIRLAQQLRQVTYVRFAPKTRHVRVRFGPIADIARLVLLLVSPNDPLQRQTKRKG